MNILTRIKSALFPKIVNASLPGGFFEWVKRYGKEPDVSQEALVRKYWGWTYMCAQLSADRIASTPLKLYASRGRGQAAVKNFATRPVSRKEAMRLRRRVGKSLPQVAGAEDYEELEEHPLLDLLRNVNDQENSYEMKELTSIMLDLTGNAYWLVQRGKLGVPEKMFVLRSQWVRVVPDREKFVSGYQYGVDRYGRDMVTLEPEEVIHFKYPNPLDPWYGMGPVQAAAYAIENMEQREKFILATMSNMARPDLIVKYLEGELDPNDRAAAEREWNAMFQGAKRTGKVKVTDFRWEMEKVGWNPAELDFNRGEDWIMKKICGAFPVPIGLVDTTQISRAPRAGMEGADLFMAQFNTLPRCTRIEEKLNEQLCPMYDERLFLAFDNPVPKDEQRQLSEDTTKLNTYRTTINELRQRDGEDEVEWGDLPLAPTGIAPLGSQPSPSIMGAGAGYPPQPSTIDATGSSAGGVSPGGAPFKKPAAQGEVPSLEQAVKSAGEGMSVEVDGAYVSPQLAGIPIRLRPTRNERGRFDRRGVGRLHAGGDDVAGLRESLRLKGGDEEEGRWVTMHGRAVLIHEGETPKEALERQEQRSSDRGSMAASLTAEAAGKLKDLQGKKASLDAKLEIAKHRMAELQARLDELKGKRRKGVDGDESSIQKELDELKKKIAAYESERGQLENAIGKIKKKGFEDNVFTKFVKEVGGEFCVFSHQTGKNFGCYPTREEAEARLAQMHKFKGEEA